MNKTIKFLVGVLAVTMLFSIMTGVCFAEEVIEEEKDYLVDIPYIDDGDVNHMCDIFGVDGTVKPVIMEVHGGGYTGCSKETNTAHCEYWAENGFIVVDINYTLMPEGTTKSEMQEFYAALQFIADNAETYGFDLNNVFISGDSAGGTHVQMIAANYANPELAAYNEVVVPENISLRAIVVSAMGVASLREIADSYLSEKPSQVAKNIGELLLDEDFVSRYELRDWMVAENYPPTILLGTPGDKIAGESILELDAYLTDLGVDHELVYLEGVENNLKHVYNILYPDYVESQEANGAAVEFMRAHMQ